MSRFPRRISKPVGINLIEVISGDIKVKSFYYQCKSCGRQIDSYDYYCYGLCENCRR